jgi:hypothetical protein
LFKSGGPVGFILENNRFVHSLASFIVHKHENWTASAVFSEGAVLEEVRFEVWFVCAGKRELEEVLFDDWFVCDERKRELEEVLFEDWFVCARKSELEKGRLEELFARSVIRGSSE